RKSIRQPGDYMCRCDRVLSVTSALGQIAMIVNGIAYLPIFYVASDSVNHPGYIKAENDWIIPTRQTGSSQLVIHRVKTDGGNFNSNFTGPWLRLRNFSCVQSIRCTRSIQNKCFHRFVLLPLKTKHSSGCKTGKEAIVLLFCLV